MHIKTVRWLKLATQLFTLATTVAAFIKVLLQLQDR